MRLYHYYDRDIGPFRNISELSDIEAKRLMKSMAVTKSKAFCNKRSADYLLMRHYYEAILRNEFLKKGGIIERLVPQYMVVGECKFLESWYENCAHLEIDISELDARTISFTYGDSHPTFSDKVNDGKEYRKKLYTYKEILKIIEKYGYPQEWNPDGGLGPERYIEAHIWSDEILERFY